MGYLIWLAATKGFRLTNLTSSRVGHTHNRLDALFGLLSRAVRFEDSLLDMEDTRERLGSRIPNLSVVTWWFSACSESVGFNISGPVQTAQASNLVSGNLCGSCYNRPRSRQDSFFHGYIRGLVLILLLATTCRKRHLRKRETRTARKLETLLHRLNVRSWVGRDAAMKVVTLGHVKDWQLWFLGSL